MVSVIVVAVEAAVSVWVAPVTPTPLVTVVIVWLDQPLVPVKVKPPTAPLLILVSVTVGSFVLVNTQVKSAPATTLPAAMVSTLPASEPIAPAFPVTALLASVQLAAVRAKPAATVSVSVTAVPTVVTLIEAGAAGVGVPAAIVVIAAGALARLVWANVNGPPKPPVVVFCTRTIGRVLVKVQAMLEPAAVAAASSRTLRVARLFVAVPPAPSPEHEIAVSAKPAGGALSVIVVAVAAAVRVCVAPVTPVPAVTVVIVWLDQPLVPVKVKPPTPPFDTLVSVTVGSFVLVNVQAIAEPAAVAAASRTRAPVPRFGVAVPPPPIPLHVAEAST